MTFMDAKASIISAATITLVLVAGCRSAASTQVETTSAQIPPTSHDKSVEAIVRAHCSHVYACDELGGTHRFDNYDECARAVQQETLRGPMCNHDIDSAKLTKCLDAIHTSGCGLPRSARFVSCRDEDLCR